MEKKKIVKMERELSKGLMTCINKKTLEKIEVKSKTKIFRRWHRNDEFVTVEIKGLSENCVRAYGLIQEAINSNRTRALLGELGGHRRFACLNGTYDGAKFLLKNHNDTPKLDCYILGPLYEIEIATPNDYNKIDVDEKALSTIKEGFLPALENLHKLKDEKNLLADLWCHFGKVFLHNVKEEETNEDTWHTVEIVSERLKHRPRARGKRCSVSDGGEPHSEVEEPWYTTFQEGVCREKISLDDTQLKLKHTHWRYDCGFVTPSGQNVRFKAWENLDDVPEEVKNLSVQVNIKDQEKVLVAWLCRPSSTLAKCDLLVPNCSYDCRIKLRTGPRRLQSKLPVEEEEDMILAEYLTQCTFKDHHLKLPDPGAVPLPEGFGWFFFRESKEDEYAFQDGDEDSGFTVLVLDENGWDSDASERRAQQQFGIRIIMNSCAEALLSGEWEPGQIIDMLPDYMEFVGLLQGHLFRQDKG